MPLSKTGASKMAGYIPVTPDEQKTMLDAVGLASTRDLYKDIPEEIYIDALTGLDQGLAEMDVQREVRALAGQNTIYDLILRGAGSYDHHIPAAVGRIAGKEEFVTSYTPYQAEISQGVLQGIFEYQTMVAEMTTMDVANASVYDGATAAGEAMAMCRDRKATKTLIAANANPMTKEVMATYAEGADAPYAFIPEKDGRLDLDALKDLLTEDVSAVYLESPNFYGLIEDVEAVADLAKTVKAKTILGANPFALALFKSPKACGVDIVVGDGQPFGLPMNYGGPSVGFMACTEKLLRKLPGRIVGQTVDTEGRRAFVLTLQAREQHIRREKASSNICSNQSLNALTTSIYCTVMGPQGVKEVAKQAMAKAHYLAGELEAIGLPSVHEGLKFHEFVTEVPQGAKKLEDLLRGHGILSGLPLGEDRMLWCVTEKARKEDLDRMVAIVKEELA